MEMIDVTEKKELNWNELGFAYMETDFSFVCDYKDGAWGAGELTPDHTVTLSECAGILHYCQECFEGLKAYTTEDGSIVCFRPELNAERMYDTAERLCMPPFPKDRFVEAVKEVVRANEAWVPPFGSGATLYIRPVLFATGKVIGVKPADEYQFRIFVTPVGPYYKGGAVPIHICVSEYDRAAPRGTGNVKAGLNYAMSLQANVRGTTAKRFCREPLPRLAVTHLCRGGRRRQHHLRRQKGHARGAREPHGTPSSPPSRAARS